MTNEQDLLIEQTEKQRDPYRARPEDWVIGPPVQDSATPGHAQRGLTKREYERLLAIRHAKNKGVDLPTATDDAEAPLT